MKKKILTSKTARWLIVWLPVIMICLTALLPVKGIVRQAFIGVVLVWFQISVMSGLLG